MGNLSTSVLTDLLQAGEIKRAVKWVRGKSFTVKLILNPNLPTWQVYELCDCTGGEYDACDNSIMLLEVVKR